MKIDMCRHCTEEDWCDGSGGSYCSSMMLQRDRRRSAVSPECYLPLSFKENRFCESFLPVRLRAGSGLFTCYGGCSQHQLSILLFGE